MDDLNAVKTVVVQYFNNRFSQNDLVKIKLPNMQMKSLSATDRAWLERKFTKEEIKEAIWDCGSDKAPEPMVSISISLETSGAQSLMTSKSL